MFYLIHNKKTIQLNLTTEAKPVQLIEQEANTGRGFMRHFIW